MLKILVILLVFIFTSSIESPQWGRNQGEWGNFITAQDNLQNLPPRYFMCGVKFLQKSWLDRSFSCNCRPVWNGFWKKLRCSACQRTFLYETGGIKIYFCNYNNWNDQIQKNVHTIQSEAWRSPSMCPQNFFVSEIAPKFWKMNSDFGLTGLKIKCESLNTNENPVYVESGGQGNYNQSYVPSNGLFVSGFKIKSKKGQALWGCSFNYSYIPLISKILFNWQSHETPNKIQNTLAQSVISNFASETTTRTSTLQGSYRYSMIYQINNAKLQGYQISSLVLANSPILDDSIPQSYYTQNQVALTFNNNINKTITTNEQITVLVPPCKSVTTKQILQSGNCKVAFNALIQFSSKIGGHVITTVNQTGEWKGSVIYSLSTKIFEDELANCSIS